MVYTPIRFAIVLPRIVYPSGVYNINILIGIISPYSLTQVFREFYTHNRPEKIKINITVYLW